MLTKGSRGGNGGREVQGFELTELKESEHYAKMWDGRKGYSSWYVREGFNVGSYEMVLDHDIAKYFVKGW